MGSRRATAAVLLVLDHLGVTYAVERGSVSGVGLGVGRGIALEGCGSLGLGHSARDGAMRLDGILAGLETFADRSAALDGLRASSHRQVISMIAAERIGSLA